MKKIIICFFILFSTVILAQEKSNLIYKEGNYTVEVKLDKGYLELEKENKIEVIFKNIDITKTRAIGKSLKFSDYNHDENIGYWIATPKAEYLKDGKYHLIVGFQGKKDERFSHEFLIDIK